VNKTTEALKLAEEALSFYVEGFDYATDAIALAAIREALAEQEITTPDVCGEVCARAKLCYGCGKALDEANAKLAEPFACETGECPDKSLCAGACECLYKAEPLKQEPVAWLKGYPKDFYAEEWFIVITIYGDRVVLKALPENYSYDFTTADGTYMKKENVKKWMQFPDSEFLPPANAAPVSAEAIRAEALEEAAKIVDHVVKSGGSTYGDVIRNLKGNNNV